MKMVERPDYGRIEITHSVFSVGLGADPHVPLHEMAQQMNRIISNIEHSVWFIKQHLSMLDGLHHALEKIVDMFHPATSDMLSTEDIENELKTETIVILPEDPDHSH